MSSEERHRAWLKQAQGDAERGGVACRLCRIHAPLDAATTLWRNRQLIFAVCDRSAQTHHVLMTPTKRGVEIRAKAKGVILVGGGL